VPASGNQETTFTINTNATDNANISVVLAQITYPNASSFNITLTNRTLTDYNNTYTPTLTDAPGTYTVTILANDTNNNINNTITTTFSIDDNIFPTLTNLSPHALNINQATTVNLTVNVTDNIGIDTVLANVTKPSGLTTTLTLTLSSTDIYNNTFGDTQEIGQYTITYIANDTNNNINNTITTTFTVADTYNNTFSDTQEIGTYTITFIANDTSNNVNSTISVFFVTNDSQPPNVTQTNTTVTTSSGDQETTYTIHTNATDNANNQGTTKRNPK